MFIFMLFGKNIKFGKATGILTKGVQKISVFAYTYCTHAERCYMRYSAILSSNELVRIDFLRFSAIFHTTLHTQ